MFALSFFVPFFFKLELPSLKRIFTLSVFLPVFGIYVGVVVKNVKLSQSRRVSRVDKSFISIYRYFFWHT